MHIISALLAHFSGGQCDHCNAKDTPLDDIRLHGMLHPVSCDGDCRLDDDVCSGQSGMTDLCDDCHRELIRER